MRGNDGTDAALKDADIEVLSLPGADLGRGRTCAARETRYPCHSVIARSMGADVLLLPTDVDGVYREFGSEKAGW